MKIAGFSCLTQKLKQIQPKRSFLNAIKSLNLAYSLWIKVMTTEALLKTTLEVPPTPTSTTTCLSWKMIQMIFSLRSAIALQILLMIKKISLNQKAGQMVITRRPPLTTLTRSLALQFRLSQDIKSHHSPTIPPFKSRNQVQTGITQVIQVLIGVKRSIILTLSSKPCRAKPWPCHSEENNKMALYHYNFLMLSRISNKKESSATNLPNRISQTSIPRTKWLSAWNRLWLSLHRRLNRSIRILLWWVSQTSPRWTLKSINRLTTKCIIRALLINNSYTNSLLNRWGASTWTWEV